MLEWSRNRYHYQTDDLDLGNTGNINDHFNTHVKILTILIDHWHTDHVDHHSNLDRDNEVLLLILKMKNILIMPIPIIIIIRQPASNQHFMQMNMP